MDATANLGDPGHRWFNAAGLIQEGSNQVIMDIDFICYVGKLLSMFVASRTIFGQSGIYSLSNCQFVVFYFKSE